MPFISNSNGRASAGSVDAIVIGAGFGGLAATYRLREAGLEVRSFERAEDVGGTWLWNKYPGARTDSEGTFYRLNFFDDLFGPWRYSERFPAQPEVLTYLRTVADKLDLRRHYSFSTSVERAIWDEARARWEVDTDDGKTWSAKYLISAVGIQSAPIRPTLEGLEEYQGQVYHSATWPAGDVDFSGKRVAVIGTGSSGIQIVPQVAKQAEHLTVFQRTPNFSVPMNNAPLTDADHEEFEGNRADFRRRVREHPFSMPYSFTGRKALDFGDEERAAIFEEAWSKGGFRFMIESFDDIGVDKAANDTASNFLRGKIKELVSDPATAEKLLPSYPYTVKRPPSGTEFFETFNQDNVDLVDVRATPFTHATPTGLATTDAEYDFDVIIFATGFDFLTGSLFRMDVRGRGGMSLEERWRDELSIYLSIAVNGFPNLFILGGPLYPGGNWPTTAEEVSTFVSQVIARGERLGADTIEVKEVAEREWSSHAAEIAEQTLMYAYGREANSYGFGANMEGKLQTVHFYMGGANAVFAVFDQQVASGFPSFEFAGTDSAANALEGESQHAS
ncbi:flavin-containing monooxygenase [Nocardia miyunensis]|uniref:flavin-containing monooxygenase n=1 Tax=Nocardia miyunensis TaxID=282684 RepID=UPI000A04EE08|nr:NAD(P)/FAD-dependent oxidoreductase [Nocardia miyunensis]